MTHLNRIRIYCQFFGREMQLERNYKKSKGELNIKSITVYLDDQPILFIFVFLFLLLFHSLFSLSQITPFPIPPETVCHMNNGDCLVCRFRIDGHDWKIVQRAFISIRNNVSAGALLLQLAVTSYLFLAEEVERWKGWGDNRYKVDVYREAIEAIHWDVRW